MPFFENYNSSPFWFVSHCDLWEGYTKNRQNDRHSFPSSERETKNQNGDEILEDLKSGTFQKMCICVLACSIPPLPLSGTPKKTWCVDFLLFLCTPPVVSHVVHTVYVNVYIPWYSTRYTPIWTEFGIYDTSEKKGSTGVVRAPSVGEHNSALVDEGRKIWNLLAIKNARHEP